MSKAFWAGLKIVIVTNITSCDNIVYIQWQALLQNLRYFARAVTLTKKHFSSS